MVSRTDSTELAEALYVAEAQFLAAYERHEHERSELSRRLKVAMRRELEKAERAAAEGTWVTQRRVGSV